MQVTGTYDEIFDAQQHFRLILDCMARPGKANMLPQSGVDYPGGINQATVLVAMALLNADTCFYTQDTAVADCFKLHTSALQVDIANADFVFMPQHSGADIIPQLKTGTLNYPEESATIIADAQSISNTTFPGALQLTLKGPGINGFSTVYVSGMDAAMFEVLQMQNEEFPLGIDLIVTDNTGNMLCIPRSTKVVYKLISNN